MFFASHKIYKTCYTKIAFITNKIRSVRVLTLTWVCINDLLQSPIRLSSVIGAIFPVVVNFRDQWGPFFSIVQWIHSTLIEIEVIFLKLVKKCRGFRKDNFYKAIYVSNYETIVKVYKH